MTNSAVQRQLNRLSLLGGFPKEPERIVVLSDMLKAVCHDESELHRSISRWCETEQFVPTEAQLRFVVATLRSEDEPEDDPRSDRCDKCGGTGRKRVFWLETQHRYQNGGNRRERQFITEAQYLELRKKIGADSTWQQQVYDGVKSCDCPLGQKIIAANLAREAADHDDGTRDKGLRRATK